MGKKKKRIKVQKNKLDTLTPSTKSPDYIAYTDGGCAFNPGGPGGYGVVIESCLTGEKKELFGGYRSTTNNRMEIIAACVALESIPANSIVRLYTDSQYLIQSLRENPLRKWWDDSKAEPEIA